MASQSDLRYSFQPLLAGGASFEVLSFTLDEA